MSRRVWWMVWLSGVLMPFSGGPVAAERDMQFLGKITSADVAKGRFVMTGGASKRFPAPEIQWNKQTVWAGGSSVAAVAPGVAVRVTAKPVGSNRFSAQRIEFMKPLVPALTGAGAARLGGAGRPGGRRGLGTPR